MSSMKPPGSPTSSSATSNLCCGFSDDFPFDDRHPRHRRHPRCPVHAVAGHGHGHRPDDARSACTGPGAGDGRDDHRRNAAAAHDRHPHRQHPVCRSRVDHRAARLRVHRRVRQVPVARRGDRMNALAAVPSWLALVIGVLILAGALLACIGSAGLLRLDTFYRRVHAPTLGTTLGMYLVLAGTIVFFWAGEGRPALHVILIGVCVTVTTPISLLLLARAALERDRRDGAAGVPAADPSETAADAGE